MAIHITAKFDKHPKIEPTEDPKQHAVVLRAHKKEIDELKEALNKMKQEIMQGQKQ